MKKEILAAALFALLACTLGSCGRQALPKPDTADGRGGQLLWIGVPAGRLKTEAFAGLQVGAHPVLLVILHGELPVPTLGHNILLTLPALDALAEVLRVE